MRTIATGPYRLLNMFDLRIAAVIKIGESELSFVNKFLDEALDSSFRVVRIVAVF